jgi:hypothetical protein
MTTTFAFAHDGTQYTIASYSSNVEVSGNGEYESIQWDDVCPTTEDKEDFDSSADYIQDLGSYYVGDLPTEVYVEAIRYAFSSKIADTLSA